jgi:hypothetical protein
MSEFFEKISQYHFNNTEENINNYNMNRVVDRFNKIFPHIENGDHYYEKYNIRTPMCFDFENKYTLQEIDKVKYIKLRLCDINEWSKILSSIFQTDIIMIEDYATENKTIGNLYKRFKNEYKLPVNFLDEMKQNKYLNLYYSSEEIKHYFNRWESKLTDHVVPYTVPEYNFYLNLCLENQYIPDTQIDHYIDNGCICKLCSLKRREIFFRIKKGEKNIEKIIHEEVVLNEKQQKMSILNKKIHTINKLNETIKRNIDKKIKNNKFLIQLKPT